MNDALLNANLLLLQGATVDVIMGGAYSVMEKEM